MRGGTVAPHLLLCHPCDALHSQGSPATDRTDPIDHPARTELEIPEIPEILTTILRIARPGGTTNASMALTSGARTTTTAMTATATAALTRLTSSSPAPGEAG